MRLKQVCPAVRQKMTGGNGKVYWLSCFLVESHSTCVAVRLHQEAFYLDFEQDLLQMAMSEARPPLCAPTPRFSRQESDGRGALRSFSVCQTDLSACPLYSGIIGGQPPPPPASWQPHPMEVTSQCPPLGTRSTSGTQHRERRRQSQLWSRSGVSTMNLVLLVLLSLLTSAETTRKFISPYGML